MDAFTLTRETLEVRRAVLLALVVNYTTFEVATFLNPARSFVFKIRNPLKTSEKYMVTS